MYVGFNRLVGTKTSLLRVGEQGRRRRRGVAGGATHPFFGVKAKGKGEKP